MPSSPCRLGYLRSRKSKLNTEAIREAPAREQSRGAQGPRDPEQARRGEGREGKGGGEGQRARGQVELMMLFSLLAAD